MFGAAHLYPLPLAPVRIALLPSGCPPEPTPLTDAELLF